MTVDDDTARRLDEPLLRSLQALLTEASVSRAAAKLGIAQSAMSRHLATLRRLTGDALLVRVGNRMVPTERAQTLVAPTRRILADMSLLVSPSTSRSVRDLRLTFRIATYDFLPKVFFSELASRVEKDAPDCNLVLQGLGSRFEHYRQLADGDVDMVITVWPEVPAHLRMTSLLNEPLMCVLRADHPLAQPGAMNLESFQRARHLTSLEHVPGQGSVIHNQLDELGITLHTTVHTQFLSLAPALMQKSDLVFTTGRLLAEEFARERGLTMLPFPGKSRPMRYRLVWHERTHANHAMRWLRNEIASVARGLAHRSREVAGPGTACAPAAAPRRS
jgi:DNA-binding transcriptional LysR family regulator